MSRVPLVPANLREPADLVAAIRARRGGGLLNLDRTLLHSPPLARAWNDYLKAIRTGLTAAPLLREIAICGVAALNGADYEFSQHEPEFLRAGGSAAAAQGLRNFAAAATDRVLFTDLERAVMDLTIRMTRNIDVDDETWGRLCAHLPDPQDQVEIVGVVAAYNMVSRFLVACRIPPEATDPQPAHE
jgi:alkylhydroperoxidase family enzyme